MMIIPMMCGYLMRYDNINIVFYLKKMFYSFHLKIRKTQNVSFFPVGHLAGRAVETPVLKDGKFSYFYAAQYARKYSIDFAGFAISVKHFLTVRFKDCLTKSPNHPKVFHANKNGSGLYRSTEENQLRLFK